MALWHPLASLPASTQGWMGIPACHGSPVICSPPRVTTRTRPPEKPARKGASRPGTKARTKPDPFSTPQTVQTHLTLLAQQRPAISVEFFPFLVKTFLF